MKSSSIYLALGSNLGDREAGLREAALRIEALGLEVVKASSIYETEPVGYLDQPLFLNQVVEVEERGSGLIGELLRLTGRSGPRPF